MFFLTPRYVKRGRLYAKAAQKHLDYNLDRWDAGTVTSFKGAIAGLKAQIKARNRAGVAAGEEELETLCGKHCPLSANAWLGENTEVIVVAIIVALGIRTYILQPFTIPTASMQPTLFGITGRPTEEEPPNILKRVLDFCVYGRTWFNVVAKDDETITKIEDTKWAVIFTYTKITTDKGNVYWANESSKPLRERFGLDQRSFAKGQPIIRGFTDTGDHVFVDKFSYHFRKPRRGEVFVFDTRDIPTGEKFLDGYKSIPNPNSLTQYYIKRLGGTPGDKLVISAPQLYVNDNLATEFALQRVMRGTYQAPVEGYRGYSNSVGSMLRRPGVPFTVDPESYFALGDNSYESSDSRDWGHVRESNLTGTGVFVYWPFSRDTAEGRGGRFGLIK